MGRLESSVSPNGNISSTWYCRNYKTDGTVAGSKGITMSMDKSGNLTYGVNDADKFLSAIGGLKVKHFVSGNYTFNAGEHKNITISFGSTSNVFNVIPISTPNAAWVFAQTHTWDSANVTLGVYNTYTSAITGTFRVMILYK